MSLMRQLWIAIILAAVTAFTGSILVSIWSTQDYLTLQLERKNSDVASSLALSLTHQDKDPITTELHVAALFDTGYYQIINISDMQGQTIAERKQPYIENNVPSWFINAFAIESKPGRALINDNWKQYGNVLVISHTQAAYQTLWEQTLRLLYWFIAGGACLGVLGMWWLRNIGKSLHAVVKQAQAIEERRFITITEPRTSELRALTHAMNSMVERVRQMFSETASRLEELRREVNFDPLTNTPNRDYFMSHFKNLLHGEEAVHCGVLLVLHLANLGKINETLGRSATDEILKQFGDLFNEMGQQQEGAFCGRIKAGEIALLLPGESNARDVAERIVQKIKSHPEIQRFQVEELYHIGAIRFEHGGNIGEMLSKVDRALAIAANQGGNSFHAIENDSPMSAIPGEQWRNIFGQAIRNSNIKLEFFPVVSCKGELIHQEGMVRLQQVAGQNVVMAGDFMPIAAHLNLTALIDLEVVRIAFNQLKHHAGPIAINLAAKTIDNWTFRDKLSAMLRSHPELCDRLWFEVAEYGALKHFDAFKDICLTLKNAGCKVGVEQFGQHLTDSKKLTELGLDYVKIHSSLIHDIHDNHNNQTFLQRFCEIAHALEIQVIAVGVRSRSEQEKLKILGVDGLTGPAIQLDDA